MKKDKLLENRFDEYRDGVYAAPYANAKAKAFMESKKRSKKTFRRVLLSACGALAVCIVAVLCVNLILPLKNGEGTDGNLDSDIDSDAMNPSMLGFYFDDSLTASELDAYGDSFKEMSFVKKMSVARNYDVVSYDMLQKDGETVLLRAEIIASVNGRHNDATVYAELSDEVYYKLKNFSEGEIRYYNGQGYVLSSSFDNGEPVANMLIETDGVKYYVSVRASDENAYLDYLKIILT